MATEGKGEDIGVFDILGVEWKLLTKDKRMNQCSFRVNTGYSRGERGCFTYIYKYFSIY